MLQLGHIDHSRCVKITECDMSPIVNATLCQYKGVDWNEVNNLLAKVLNINH